MHGRQLGKNGRDFPADMGVFSNFPGFIGIYSGFQNLKFLADIQGKIGEEEIRQAIVMPQIRPYGGFRRTSNAMKNARPAPAA